MAVGTKDLAPDNLRGFGDDRLVEELRKAKEELFNLRFQSATGQLDSHGRLRAVKRDIARIYTEMRERELGIRATPAPVETKASKKKAKKAKKSTRKVGMVQPVRSPGGVEVPHRRSAPLSFGLMTQPPMTTPMAQGSGGFDPGQDIYNRLLKERIVFLGTEVNDTIANQLAAQILYLDGQDPEKDIWLYINSPGGSVTAGVAIFDTMQWVKPDVATVGSASQRSRAYLSAMFMSCPDLIIGETPDGVINVWNRAAERLYSYSAQEAIGQPVSMLAPDGRETELTSLRRRVLQGQSVEPHETARRAKDGRLLDVSLTIFPVRDDAGTIIGAATTTREITQRRRDAAALAASERRFRAAFDDAPDGMALVGLQGEFLQVNRAGCELVGYSEQELLHMSIADIVHPDELEAELLSMTRVIRDGGRGDNNALRLVHRDGSVRWVMTSSRARAPSW